jgi:hypothetical protein
MYQVTIPESKDILFESIFEPSPVGVNKLRKDIGASEGMIEGFKGKKNRVAVGRPYLEPLISRMQDKNEEISHEIKRLAEKYDFHFVAMTCVLQPDVDCKFEWARFGVELYAVDSNLGTIIHPSDISPIAYSLFPEDISSEIKVSSKRSITSELKIKASIIEAGIGGSANKDEEYVIYQPQITGYGLDTTKVAWDFKSTQEKAVMGNKKVQLVIQTPKDTKVKGKFILGAEVSSSTSRWRRVPVSIRKDDAVIAQYNLSE